MNFKRDITFLFSLLLPFFVIVPLQAQVLEVSNLSNTDMGEPVVDSGNSYAASFITGSSGTFTLTSASLWLYSPSTFDTSLVLSLYSNSPTTGPNTLLGTFTVDNPVNGSYQAFSFTPTSSLTLAASTQYWLGLSSSLPSGGAGTTSWSFTKTSSYTSNDGWMIDTATSSEMSFSPSWSTFAGSSAGGNTFRFSVTAIAAVPEPSVWTLLGLGCLGLVIFYRKRSMI